MPELRMRYAVLGSPRVSRVFVCKSYPEPPGPPSDKIHHHRMLCHGEFAPRGALAIIFTHFTPIGNGTSLSFASLASCRRQHVNSRSQCDDSRLLALV